MLITYLFVPKSNQSKNLKSTWRCVQNLRISQKLGIRVTPEGQIYGQNSKFWQFWWLYSHISAAINMKSCGGEKPIFGPLSKNNTGMAALHAGLPVTRYTNCWVNNINKHNNSGLFHQVTTLETRCAHWWQTPPRCSVAIWWVSTYHTKCPSPHVKESETHPRSISGF